MDPVKVEGLRDLRKALRQTDRGALKEVQQVSKEGAELVARAARPLAPERPSSGRLQASIRATTSGDKGIVRSRLPYAAVHEWGGTISPRGRAIKIERSRFIGRALKSTDAQLERLLQNGFDEVARRSGWR